MSDRLVEAAKETAGDAVERGKQIAQDAAGAAKESGREQGQELADGSPRMLCETGLPPRYYFDPADVRLDLLTPSETESG